MLYRVGHLPDAPLAAAARFYALEMPEIVVVLVKGIANLTLIFPPADHSHRAWRLAVVQELARQYAPIRINAVVSADEVAIAAAVTYLDGAAGVTGQMLMLDSHGAGNMIQSAL